MTLEQNPAFVQTAEDLTRLDGQQVVVIGHYHAIAQPMKGLVRKELPKDRALLQLADGTKIYLEPLDSRRSRRRLDEIRRFDGKRVRVRGTAYALMPSRGQSLIAPCIGDVREIREDQ